MLKKRIAFLVAVVMMAVMALPMTANFTPSATMKPAPEVVPIYEDYVAILIDEDGNFVEGITGPELIITPYVKRNEARYPEIKDMLERAFSQINAVDSLSRLCNKLDGTIKEYAPELSADTVIVGDLIDVTLVSEKGEILKRDDISIKIRFKLTYDAIDLISILHNYEGENWETVQNSRITRGEEKTVDVVLNSLCPLAFLVDSGELIVPSDGPDSPQTGAMEDSSFVAAFICSVGALICTVAVIAVRKKNLETK